VIGDAMSHSVVPVWRGLYVGAAFALGAFFAGRYGGGGVCFLSGRSGLRSDVIIGIFVRVFWCGPLMVSLSPCL